MTFSHFIDTYSYEEKQFKKIEYINFLQFFNTHIRIYVFVTDLSYSFMEMMIKIHILDQCHIAQYECFYVTRDVSTS